MWAAGDDDEISAIAVLAQCCLQLDRLRDGNGGVVVAVDEEEGRRAGVHVRDG